MIKKISITIILSAFLLFINAQHQGFVHESSNGYIYPEEQEVLEKLDQWQDLKFGVLFH